MNLVEDEPEAVALPKEDGEAALEAWKAGHLLADVAVSRRAERGIVDIPGSLRILALTPLLSYRPPDDTSQSQSA